MLVGAGIGVTPCASIMKGVINYRWKKGYSPVNLHFFWVARLSDLATFKWLLVTLPELKAAQLMHNEHYNQDEAARGDIVRRLSLLRGALSNKEGAAAAGLPEGWALAQAPGGQAYYFNQTTGETSWEVPRPSGSTAATREEMTKLQTRIRNIGAEDHRSLTITLYLTGCKPEQLKPVDKPARGSPEELIKALQSATDPATGQPYVDIRAGRPNWDADFKRLAAIHGKEEIGVVFCGAPAIAAALKEACEKHSTTDGTRFKLHKENF
mmetsp:Transcript_17131/g.39261  ORF Transcript_17131/g.39261 Transcript_17131/m.39261 type:complete len:267 (-) Transcript_17131:544-1344(-)